MSDAAADAQTGPAAQAARINAGQWAWALFEWARNPYVILITIYVFSPYVSRAVFTDPIEAQAVIHSWHRTAGIIVALTAPFLGAAADRMGRRKPMLGVVMLIMAPAIFALWWAAPAGQGGLTVAQIGVLITVIGVCFAYTEVLHNSMLPSVAPPRLLPHVSGLGLALGNAASVLLLVGVLWCLALPGVVSLPGLLSSPMFGLDPAAGEPSRITAPLSAVWFVLFAIPLFLLTPDGQGQGQPFFAAAREGVSAVLRTIVKLRDHANIALFLIARMFYADGKTAVLIAGGVYAALTFEWGLLEMSVFGIILSMFAVVGGILGGVLDEWMGPKRAVALEIGVTTLCLLGMVSMAPDALFFVIPNDPAHTVWASPMFATAPELAYLGIAMIVAISITAAYASSRTLMAQLAPKGMEGELFGLYALAGAATVWLGPLLVEHFTETYQSLKAGFGSVSILLVIGFVLVMFVKPPARPAH